MPLNTILELYLHPESKQIKPRYVWVDLKPGEMYLIEVDLHPESLPIRQAPRYEISMHEGPNNFYHSVVWVDDEKVGLRNGAPLPNYRLTHFLFGFNKVKIRDLGSVEGTYVNKLNINRETFELKDGDVIVNIPSRTAMKWWLTHMHSVSVAFRRRQ
jgi:hypothetical protein